MNTGHRFPAEWEPVEAVLVAWPHSDTDWNYMLGQVQDCYRRLIAAISRYAKVIVIGPEKPDVSVDNIVWVEMPTNDTWTRDYGPLTVLDADGTPRLIDYKFNGWGLKFASDRDNLATMRLCDRGILSSRRTNRLSFVLEGGSIESDGRGTAMVTADCLLSPNRNGGLTKQEIEAQLVADLGLDRLVWLTNGALEGDDTDGHIDTLVRIAPGDVLFHVTCGDPSDSHYACLKALEDELRALRTAGGKPYRLVALPIPPAILDVDDGTRLPATYANFLFVNGAVLVPVYDCPEADRVALDAIAGALPDFEVVPVDCSALIHEDF